MTIRRNVSDDGDMFKETKLLLYFRIENHGYVTKTGIAYVKQIIFAVISETFLLFNFVNTSKPKKLSAKPNSFWELGSRVPPLFPALMQGSNEDFLPMKGHTRGGNAPTM